MKRKPVYMLLDYVDESAHPMKQLVRTINGKFDNEAIAKSIQEAVGTKNDFYLIDVRVITPALYRIMLRRGK